MYKPANPAPMTTASTSRAAVDEAMPKVSLLIREVLSACVEGGLPSRVADRARTNRFDDLLEAALAAGQEQDGEEAVHLAGVAPEVDGNAGFPEAFRVGLSFVAEDIVLRGQHHCGWEPSQAGGVRWGRIRLETPVGVGDVVLPEPDHRV